MNDNHTDNNILYKPRWKAELIRDAIKAHPVVILTGARQVGKTTLLRHEPLLKDYKYLTLDNLDVLEIARKNPDALWAGTDTIIIDEVQKAPTVLSAIKQAVDLKHRNIHFVLSGSANLLLMAKVTDSLAGRTVHFTLDPMTLGEILGTPIPHIFKNIFQGKLPKPDIAKCKKEDIASIILKGFMPPLLGLSSTTASTQWWEGYVLSYMERDLRQISRIENLPDFRRVMIALAARTGSMLNQTEIARDAGVNQPTVNRYINLMEVSYLFYKLNSFAMNRSKRIIKTPKAYFVDPALPAFLINYYDADSLKDSKEFGSLFENLIFFHLKVLSELTVPKSNIYYWRTTTNKEVDFIIEYGNKLIPIEVKLSSKVNYSDAQTLRLFLQDYHEAIVGLLIYTGDKIEYLDKKIIAIPYHYITKGAG